MKSMILCWTVWLLMTGCSKNDEDVLFRMEYDQVITMPSSMNTLETYSFLLENLATNFSTLTATYNVSGSAVSAIRPGLIRLQDELNQLDFAKIERISLLASKPGFQQEMEIAYLEPVPLTSSNSIQLFPSLVDGLPVFSGDNFNLKLKVKLRGFISANARVRLRIQMNAIR
jgi:hypothetical protein